MRYAVGLGGDTDTVAAITGGILGCRDAEVTIGWLDRVQLPDSTELDRFWVIGPIAWDRVLHVPRLPASGGFVQATGVTERPGGAGANVAIALASTGAVVHMVGYTGGDEAGSRMREVLGEASVDARWVQGRSGHTSEVVILVEPSGERTIIGLWPDLLATVPVPVADVRPGTWRTSPHGMRSSARRCGSSRVLELPSPRSRRRGCTLACPPST